MTDRPGDGVLERGGEPGPGPRPGHRGNHHPVFAAGHPRRGGLQEHLSGAQVQTPPAPRIPAGVIAWAAPLAAPAAPRCTGLDPHLRDEHLLAPPVGLQVHRLDHRVLDPEHPAPYPRSAHVVPVVVLTVEGQNSSTRRRAPVIPRSSRRPPSNRGSGALRTSRAGPRPARNSCPKGLQRLAGQGGREAPPRSDAADALDLGGAAPHRAQRPRTGPTETAEVPLNAPNSA